MQQLLGCSALVSEAAEAILNIKVRYGASNWVEAPSPQKLLALVRQSAITVKH